MHLMSLLKRIPDSSQFQQIKYIFLYEAHIPILCFVGIMNNVMKQTLHYECHPNILSE